MRNSIFSERLAAIMAHRVISQDELAKATHLSQSAISRLLNSKYEPRSSDLVALSTYFDVGVGWLLGTDPNAAPPPADNDKAKEKLPKVNPRRVDVRLVNEAALRALVKKLRKQADDLEHTCDELFRP